MAAVGAVTAAGVGTTGVAAGVGAATGATGVTFLPVKTKIIIITIIIITIRIIT